MKIKISFGEFDIEFEGNPADYHPNHSEGTNGWIGIDSIFLRMGCLCYPGLIFDPSTGQIVDKGLIACEHLIGP